MNTQDMAQNRCIFGRDRLRSHESVSRRPPPEQPPWQGHYAKKPLRQS